MCSNDEMVYVSSPKNVNYDDFIVEVWGESKFKYNYYLFI